MGEELALLAGSLMPELISSVTAVCPTNISSQGFAKKKSIQMERSAFSWRGKELPGARLKLSKATILWDSLRERSVCLRSCYEDAVLNATGYQALSVLDGQTIWILPLPTRTRFVTHGAVVWQYACIPTEEQTIRISEQERTGEK